MKKGYLYFLFSLIAGAVIIGTTFTFINANNNKSNNEMKVAENKEQFTNESKNDIEDLKKEIKLLQDRVSTLENDNKSIKEEMDGLKFASNKTETTNTTTVIREKVVDNDKVDELESKLEDANNKINELEENQNANIQDEDEQEILPEIFFITTTYAGYYNIRDNWEMKVRSISVTKGDSKTLDYYIYPNDSRKYANVTWESSDTSIATVENGKITAIKPGECTITAKTKNGLESSIKLSVSEYEISSVNVEVEENYNNEISKYNISFDRFCISHNSIKSRKINVVDNSNNKDFNPYTYICSNEDILTIDKEGYITLKSTGNCQVTIKGQEGLEKTFDIEVYTEET